MSHAVITLYDDIPDDEIDEFVSLLDDAGLDAEVGPPQVRMGPTADAVLQMIIQAPIDVLTGALATIAGERAWRYITGILDRRRDARRSGVGERDDRGEESDGHQIVVIIVDSKSEDRIELSRNALHEASLPDLAAHFHKPAEDRSAVLVRWDDNTKTWLA
jgi:hypothetical protein